MPRWRNGRRSGLKIRFPYGSGGSNPFLGTTFDVILEAPLMNPLVRRISNLDLIRGIALLGILGMNAISFGLPWAAYWNLSAAGSETWLDFAIGVFCEIFLDQKMMGLFSLLFGTSIVLLVDAAKERGYRRPVLLSVWRNLLLFIIGIIHSLFWDGDVLRLGDVTLKIGFNEYGWNIFETRNIAVENQEEALEKAVLQLDICLLYTSPSPRD